MRDIIHACIFLLLLIITVSTSFAKDIKQITKANVSLSVGGFITENERWLYVVELENKLNLTENRFDEGSGTGLLGYAFNDRLIFWAGYKGVLKELSMDALRRHMGHRVIQQLIWKTDKTAFSVFGSRTRLEERTIAGDPNWLLRLKQRFIVEFPKYILNKYTPIFYDEVEFDLNSSNAGFVENKIFIGLSFPVGIGKALQVGYKNKYKLVEKRMEHEVKLSFKIRADLF